MSELIRVFVYGHRKFFQPSLDRLSEKTNFWSRVQRSMLSMLFWIIVIAVCGLLSILPMLWALLTLLGWTLAKLTAQKFPEIPPLLWMVLYLSPSAGTLVWLTYSSIKPSVSKIYRYFTNALKTTKKEAHHERNN